eukprot:354365-Prymnesium_polylepis.1
MLRFVHARARTACSGSGGAQCWAAGRPHACVRGCAHAWSRGNRGGAARRRGLCAVGPEVRGACARSESDPWRARRLALACSWRWSARGGEAARRRGGPWTEHAGGQQMGEAGPTPD